MTPFVKWLKKTRDKIFGEWEEGPEPPARLETMVRAFANMYPHATRAEWIDFATGHAGEAYKSGYIRGVSYIERNEDMWMPDIPPEELADAIDPTWRDSIAVSPYYDLSEVVPEEFADADILRHQLDETLMMRK